MRIRRPRARLGAIVLMASIYWSGRKVVCSCGQFRIAQDSRQIRINSRYTATHNIQLIDTRLINDSARATDSIGSTWRRIQINDDFKVSHSLSTYKLKAGLPVTKMLGFSNKINNKINLITIIYRYSYIYILQSAISPISEEQKSSAATGKSDKDNVLKWWRQYREEERCTVAGAAKHKTEENNLIWTKWSRSYCKVSNCI